jgi:DNA-binding XRE family transcriptional regulator
VEKGTRLKGVKVGSLRKIYGGGVIDGPLAQLVFQYRADQGLTQRELAEKVHLHQSSVCQAEQCLPISVKVRARLHQFFQESLPQEKNP